MSRLKNKNELYKETIFIFKKKIIDSNREVKIYSNIDSFLDHTIEKNDILCHAGILLNPGFSELQIRNGIRLVKSRCL